MFNNRGSRPSSRVADDVIRDPGEISGHAPLIQISHPNVPLGIDDDDDNGCGGGLDNPVFDIVDERHEAPGSVARSSVSSPAAAAGKPGSAAGEVPKAGVTIREHSPSESDQSVEEIPDGEVDTSGVPTLHVPEGIRQRKPSIDTIGSASDLNVHDEGPGTAGRGALALGAPGDGQDLLSLPVTNRWSSGNNQSSSPGSRSLRSNSEWSEVVRLDRLTGRKDSIGSFHSDEETSSLTISTAMSGRLRELVRKFSTRTEYFKEKTVQPPTPSTDGLDAKSATSAASAANLEPPARTHRLDSFVPVSSRASGLSGLDDDAQYIGFGKCKIKVPRIVSKHWPSFNSSMDATNRFYIMWLALVTLAYMYNATTSTLRACFHQAKFAEPDYVKQNVTKEICDVINDVTTSAYDYATTVVYDNVTGMISNVTDVMQHDYTASVPLTTSANVTCRNETGTRMVAVPRFYSGFETEENRIYWWICDYTADFLYLMDILLVKNRIRFVRDGLLEKDRKECAKHYFSQNAFKMDVASLMPLDLLYFIPSVKYNSLLRLPRLLKLQVMWELFDKLDHMVKSAHFVRVGRTLTYMLFLIHLESCGYYALSAYEGLGLNEWTYDGNGNAYIRCVYLATKTATSIGNNPRPQNEAEYMFMTAYWLSGVFVFAMLIGQIRDIFEMAGAAKDQYRKTMDNTIYYMKSLNIPKDLQDRVKTWFSYNWEHSKTLNENSLLEALPKKMKADLAIHVHYSTLSKVQLFQDCDKNLLFDLVLKLKPVLYLPQDYICRKGEVGTEMYIVMQGQVEVVGGENNSIVFATLHTGSVFGEISLLALAGGNRRTADVRSKGFSQLFILSKFDFEEAMSDYPEAQKILKKKAKKLLQQNAKKTEESKKMESEEVIKSRTGTPKLLKTVVQIIESDKMHDMLGTRRSSKTSGSRAGSRGSFLSNISRISDRSKLGTMQDEVHSISKYALDDDFEDEMLVVEQTETELSKDIDVGRPMSQTEDLLIQTETSMDVNVSMPGDVMPSHVMTGDIIPGDDGLCEPVVISGDIDGDNDKGTLRTAGDADTVMGTLGVTDDSNSISHMSLNSGINSILSTPTKAAPGRGGRILVLASVATNDGGGVDVSSGGVKEGLLSGSTVDHATTSHDQASAAPGNMAASAAAPSNAASSAAIIIVNEQETARGIKEKETKPAEAKSVKSSQIKSNKVSPLIEKKASVISVSNMLSFKSNKVVPAIKSAAGGGGNSTEMQKLSTAAVAAAPVPLENRISVSVEVHREKSRTPSLTAQTDTEQLIKDGDDDNEEEEEIESEA